MSADPNVLYYGDNLVVLRRHIADESVDLVYLDPRSTKTLATTSQAERSQPKPADQQEMFG